MIRSNTNKLQKAYFVKIMVLKRVERANKNNYKLHLSTFQIGIWRGGGYQTNFEEIRLWIEKFDCSNPFYYNLKMEDVKYI